MAKKRMQMAQKSWKIEEIFPRFVNAQMAKGVSDKTVLTYNRHFHSLGYHLDMTMTFDELTKEALDSMLVSLRKSGVSPNTISSYAKTNVGPHVEVIEIEGNLDTAAWGEKAADIMLQVMAEAGIPGKKD